MAGAMEPLHAGGQGGEGGSRECAARGGAASVGIARSVFNFTTLIIGGGLLGWPNMFRLCGWLGGVCCLLVCGLLAESTMCLIVRIGIISGTASYEETCCVVWGRAGYYIIAVTCYLIDFGVLVTYWVALGDLLAPIAGEHVGEGELHVRLKLVIAAVMFLPCYLRNLGKLPGWSYINYGLIVFSLFSMLFLSIGSETADYNRDHVAPFHEPIRVDTTMVKDDVWPSLGTVAFTFCSHDSAFMVYSTLRDGTSKRWARTVRLALWSTMALMIATGLPIYFALGDKAASDVTTNFPDGTWMRAVRIALAASVAFSWIFLQQVARKYLRSIVMPLLRRRALTAEETYEMSICELVCFTTAQFAVTLALGCCIEDLGLPMALTGVFALSIAAFVVPPCLLLTSARRGVTFGYSRLAQLYFCGVLAFGIVSCTLGVRGTISSYAK